MASKTEQILSGMTLDEKIGQLLILGWKGENPEEDITVSKHARLLLDEFHVGGVVLLGRNVGTPEQTARTMNELQAGSKIPLYIAVDQEGGMVARFRDPYVVFPSNMALGATGTPEYAYKAAHATAKQLRAVGVNFDFAPSVDVNNNPLNPIIGTRSYGDNPETVARFASEAIRGYHDGGVLTSAKHFPGHGDTSTDSHLALPVVDFPRERMDRVELPPFRAAIDAGVASIMTTHIMFPALDKELPATLSPTILGGLLRKEMGYDGVVVTDCLEMKGVAVKWGTPAAALLALKAGADCPLICHTLSIQREAFKLIKQAVESGEITMERLEQSVRRVLNLKERFGILDGVKPADPTAALAVVGSEENKALALEISRKSVTVVKNTEGVIPARLAEGDRIVVASMHPSLAELTAYVKAIHPLTDSLQLDTAQANALEPVRLPGDTRLVIVATCKSEPWTPAIDEEAQTKLVRGLLRQEIPVVLLALRDPYDISRIPEARSYVTIYGYRSTTSLQAAAEVILGVTEASGRAPVVID